MKYLFYNYDTIKCAQNIINSVKITIFMLSLKEIFQNIEADNWFARNNKNKNLEHGLSKINDLLKNGDKILEIGCSNASKLHKIELNTKFKLEYFGIDPSIKSIEDGTKNIKISTLLWELQTN